MNQTELIVYAVKKVRQLELQRAQLRKHERERASRAWNCSAPSSVSMRERGQAGPIRPGASAPKGQDKNRNNKTVLQGSGGRSIMRAIKH